MNRKTDLPFLEEEMRLLVQHFGIDSVREALTKVSQGAQDTPAGVPSHRANVRLRQSNPTVASTLEQFRQQDEEKYQLVSDFYAALKDRAVLPDPQDIRHFAQRIGLKTIQGKSRKAMLPGLIRFLLDRPTQRLRRDLLEAATISEEQRERGFSILADKLMEKTSQMGSTSRSEPKAKQDNGSTAAHS